MGLAHQSPKRPNRRVISMAARAAPSRLLRLCAAFVVVAGVGRMTVQAADSVALRGEAQTTLLLCSDLGVQMHIRRTAAMPLEELSELHTGKSCAKATVMTKIVDEAQRGLDGVALEVMDCVTTQIDEELVGLYTVMRVCSSADAKEKISLAVWDGRIRPRLERLFDASSDGRGGTVALQYHRSKVEMEKLTIPTSYERKAADPADDSDDVPRFKYKAAELWTIPASENAENSVVLLKLKVKNDGSAPLHLFAATLKIVDEPASSGLLLLTPERVEALAPSKEASVLFQFQMPHVLEFPDETSFAVYFAHTSSRAHVLDARLDGKKLKFSDKKKSSSKKKDLFGVHKLDDASSLQAAYTKIPYGMWQLLSMAVVMVVGVATTLYMRRKWTGVNWARSLDCFKHKTLKHKGSSLSKMTEMKTLGPEDALDADTDALEFDSFLSAASEPTSSEPPKPTKSALREKMPAIRMQWKKPAILRNKLTIRRPLMLDGAARLDPKRFENLWEEFIQRHNTSFAAKSRPSSEIFVQTMALAGISCMASGRVGGVEKYVLYAKQSDAHDFFFVSVDVLVASNETSVSIRASKDTNESLVEQFVALVDKQLELLLKT